MLEFFRNSKSTRYLMLALLLIMAGGTAMSAWAAKVPEPAEELKEYIVLEKPVPVTTGAKIEVAEVFWYRCPHCLTLLPGLEAWQKKMPRHAKMVYLPAVMGPHWEPAARLFHTLRALNAQERLHVPIFTAYHFDHLNLDDSANAQKWAKAQGIDPQRFLAAYNSAKVTRWLAEAAKRVAAVQLDGVPAIVVDGRYVTTLAMAGTPERMLEVVDQLIKKARLTRKPAKSLEK
jgi:thiol:disulfide interchange protein DsbA